MERKQLGSYDLMVISKYFETIEDFINLEISTPKAKGNMGKFHFNPIALDEWSRQFFTSLETLHIYNEEDNCFPEEQFYKRIIRFEIPYSEEWAGNKKENEEYKDVVLDKETVKELGRIPEGVTRIGQWCYKDNNNIKEIIMPNSVTSIERESFYKLDNVTRIVLSSNLKRIPNSSFCELKSLKEIEIPDSVTSIGGQFLNDCDQLTAMTIPTHWKRIGDRFFNNRPFLSSSL